MQYSPQNFNTKILLYTLLLRAKRSLDKQYPLHNQQLSEPGSRIQIAIHDLLTLQMKRTPHSILLKHILGEENSTAVELFDDPYQDLKKTQFL